MLLIDKKQEFGGKNLFCFPIYLQFIACLPINFFYIETFNVPFLGRLLVKKAHNSFNFCLCAFYPNAFRLALILTNVMLGWALSVK